ncbi:hypothetical protein EVG20_g7106 [Dentipellis fragilis]|uniref:Uncharacterized protein n=1 Tax=Dentipellis fragilis TaxID=205917 RepID=A0A4Y9YFI4_9AGAM|nr:hypothetical protein EVG20_g7106 [Dentipellis fragilis]
MAFVAAYKKGRWSPSMVFKSLISLIFSQPLNANHHRTLNALNNAVQSADDNVSHSTGTITEVLKDEEPLRLTIRNDNTGKETTYQACLADFSSVSCSILNAYQEMNIVKKID